MPPGWSAARSASPKKAPSPCRCPSPAPPPCRRRISRRRARPIRSRCPFRPPRPPAAPAAMRGWIAACWCSPSPACPRRCAASRWTSSPKRPASSKPPTTARRTGRATSGPRACPFPPSAAKAPCPCPSCSRRAAGAGAPNSPWKAAGPGRRPSPPSRPRWKPRCARMRSRPRRRSQPRPPRPRPAHWRPRCWAPCSAGWYSTSCPACSRCSPSRWPGSRATGRTAAPTGWAASPTRPAWCSPSWPWAAPCWRCARPAKRWAGASSCSRPPWWRCWPRCSR